MLHATTCPWPAGSSARQPAKAEDGARTAGAKAEDRVREMRSELDTAHAEAAERALTANRHRHGVT